MWKISWLSGASALRLWELVGFEEKFGKGSINRAYHEGEAGAQES